MQDSNRCSKCLLISKKTFLSQIYNDFVKSINTSNVEMGTHERYIMLLFKMFVKCEVLI